MRPLHLAAILFAALAAFAQQQPGPAAVRLSGRVLDENSAPLSGAEVTLRLDASEVHAFADPAGAFLLTVSAPGEYEVAVLLPGYFKLQQRKVRLAAGPNEITLVLSRVRDRLESLDVSGIPAVIDLDKTARDQRLNSDELLAIPYHDNNDLRQAMRILPGVVQDQHGGIHVNGAAEDQVMYTLDGFNLNDPLTGTFQSRISVDGVQSMSVVSGAVPAEFGKGAAGVLQVNTKNGDDQFRYSATNFIPGIQDRKGLRAGSWSPRVSVSGPLQKGRVWFSDTVTTQYSLDVVRDLPAGHDTSSSWRFGDVFRAQINLTPSNILYAGFLANYWRAGNSGLSALDPEQTTTAQRASQWFSDLKDQIYLGHGALLEFGFASNHTFGRQVPQGTELYVYTPYGRSGNYFIDGRQRSAREQWIANYFPSGFRLAGSHQLKMGVDVDRVDYWQDIRRTGYVNYRTDNTLARQVTFAGSGLLDSANLETSAYLQDSWRVRPGLLFEIGARTDRDQILKNWTLAPRAGFAWSPSRSERIKVSGGYGVVYSATNLALFTRPLDQYAISTFYPDGAGAPVSTVSNFINNGGLATPRYQNFNLGWQQRLDRGIVAGVQATGRIGQHGLSYFDVTALAPQTIYKLQSGQHDEYAGIEFTVRQNLHRQYQWLASYTRSLARSNSVLDLSPDQPFIVTQNYGRLPWDAPNRLLTWGLLPTPLKAWSFAYLGEWHSGFPFSVLDDKGLVIGGVNSLRLPMFFDIDLALERQFALRGQRIAWRMGMSNVTNHQNPDTVNNNVDSPIFLRYYGGNGRGYDFRVRWLGKQ